VKGCAITAALAAGALVSPDAQAPRFRTGVELVAVDVLVTDGRRPIPGLTVANFELRDAGVPQKIERLDVGTLPVSVILALDVSNSLAGRRLEHLKLAATSIVDKLHPPDRVALLTFSHQIVRHTTLTTEHERVRGMVRALSTGGSTALRDGVSAALTLKEADGGRALLVVFSDGMDTASFLSEARVTDAARRSDLVIYGVGSRAPPDGVRLHVSPLPASYGDEAFLESLADATGGRVELADGDDDIARAFERVLAEFRARYVLWFTPTAAPAPGWRRLDVRLKNRRGEVTARRGYFGR
jgi:VWFA-related protein